MTCAPIISNLGLADQDIEGSYCIKPGTEYDPSALPGTECSASSSDPTTDCGNGRANP